MSLLENYNFSVAVLRFIKFPGQLYEKETEFLMYLYINTPTHNGYMICICIEVCQFFTKFDWTVTLEFVNLAHITEIWSCEKLKFSSNAGTCASNLLYNTHVHMTEI